MSVNKQNAISALEIRDTSAHTSDTIFNGDFVVKTLVIENGLNQICSFQCQGSAHADFSNSFNIGSSWDVAANTNAYMTCENYFPYWRIIATCAVAPASGSLTVITFGVA